ncbi:MAG TPA: 2Fe-2S iron-sulfur cluster-binding protein [Bradyrhizobium sp.]|uniref:xanthine dehydrogenase family Fe-S subunit n=1 Tax=Bradyrhizobium sp. TaxID=376 RepID=UPI002D7F813C|nr:2Fe-2S iron-sulfur cluster-binding protein [Bradyrhizobium sp.]HET7888280.1 2Fe-2S iron-sulfur cluster-binding protein [Bradyrhizobium sp.]
MTTIGLSVNGRAITKPVDPRTHLADFLRDQLDLTGTHLGCEHGVCGACTLLIDDMPARSCITFAAACDGAQVTTIEGLDDDEIAAELRTAFSREHALQCGYCTPGMMISARDLVLRLETSDERAIRVGMSGNLCRCTGYVGIVRAIRSVIDARRARGIAAVPGAGRRALGPVGSGNGSSTSTVAALPPAQIREKAQNAAALDVPDFTPDKNFDEQFTVAFPPAKVFEMFGDIERVAACLPGASLTATPSPERAEGLIGVKLGPISANFHGAVRIERDPAMLSGRIIGIGNDRRSRSSTQGDVRYRLLPLDGGAATRVELSIGYSLRGFLAQVAREALVRDLARRLTAEFARNLGASLSGATPVRPKQLNGLALVFDVVKGLLKSLGGNRNA